MRILYMNIHLVYVIPGNTIIPIPHPKTLQKLSANPNNENSNFKYLEKVTTNI